MGILNSLGIREHLSRTPEAIPVPVQFRTHHVNHKSAKPPQGGNCSTWRMSNCNWRQCQIDFSFPLGWFLGIKPTGRLLEENLPNWSYLQSIFYARCCLRKYENQQTVVLVYSLKRADFYTKKRKWRFADFLRCTESVCSQKIQNHEERTGGSPRS